jgi:uncharacterized protein
VRPNVIDWIALVLVIVGGLNWGLVGLFDWNLVAEIFGEGAFLTNTIYVIVGIAALWMIYLAVRMAQPGVVPEPTSPGERERA